MLSLHKKTPILIRRWCQNWCQMKFGMFHFARKSHKNKEKPRQKPWFLWLRRQDSNLRPVAILGIFVASDVASSSADRCHSLASLFPPPAAPLLTKLCSLSRFAVPGKIYAQRSGRRFMPTAALRAPPSSRHWRRSGRLPNELRSSVS